MTDAETVKALKAAAKALRASMGKRLSPPVLRFDMDGRVIAGWGGPGAGFDWFESEHGVSVDAAGHVWLGGNGGKVSKIGRDFGRFRRCHGSRLRSRRGRWNGGSRQWFVILAKPRC